MILKWRTVMGGGNGRTVTKTIVSNKRLTIKTAPTMMGFVLTPRPHKPGMRNINHNHTGKARVSPGRI
jgi:hypothetical protein